MHGRVVAIVDLQIGNTNRRKQAAEALGVVEKQFICRRARFVTLDDLYIDLLAEPRIDGAAGKANQDPVVVPGPEFPERALYPRSPCGRQLLRTVRAFPEHSRQGVAVQVATCGTHAAAHALGFVALGRLGPVDAKQRLESRGALLDFAAQFFTARLETMADRVHIEVQRYVRAVSEVHAAFGDRRSQPGEIRIERLAITLPEIKVRLQGLCRLGEQGRRVDRIGPQQLLPEVALQPRQVVPEYLGLLRARREGLDRRGQVFAERSRQHCIDVIAARHQVERVLVANRRGIAIRIQERGQDRSGGRRCRLGGRRFTVMEAAQQVDHGSTVFDVGLFIFNYGVHGRSGFRWRNDPAPR